MPNKVRIKMGPIEFEAEGDSDLIEREREKFFSLLPQAITAVSPVVAKPAQIIDATNRIEELENTNGPTTLLPDAKENKYTSIAAFLNEKKFSTEVELVMGVAYFIEIIEQGGYITAKDIESKLTEARRDKPSNTSQDLTQNIKKGFLRECPEKKETLKLYSVLEDGIKWCEGYIPKANDQKKKANKNRSTRSTVDSNLLSISLDELNLEKYCDISSLDKFNDQVLVVMLIYTKEKNIEYFSFNDIVAVLKNKFKMPGTDRKVRYVFDHGGTMFDKKVEKKIAYHKLMNSGIQEAERIVAEHKTVIISPEK
jgi:hypothetical protein